MHLAIEIRYADRPTWHRVETTEPDPYFPDVLHRTYKALVDSGAAEAALMWCPDYKAITVFHRSDSPSLIYFRYQEAQTTYGRYKKIYAAAPVPGQRLGEPEQIV